MTLPFSTTLIEVLRSDNTGDGWPDSEPGWSVVVDDVPAVISSPSGTYRQEGSTQEVSTFRLACENCDLQHSDRVRDVDGSCYDVVWVQRREGLGLDHVSAGLSRVIGVLP